MPKLLAALALAIPLILLTVAVILLTGVAAFSSPRRARHLLLLIDRLTAFARAITGKR